jgi:drug/metabolite transporter (DMT)-like permease
VSVVLYLLLCLIWGSTWLVIKVGYGDLGPFNVAAARFLVAGVVLTLLVPLLGARWPSGRAEWALVLFVGVVLFGADYGLIYWGEQYLASGLTAVLFATLPLFTMGLAHWYVPGDRMTGRRLTGAMLALAGVVALFGDRITLDPSRAGPMAAIVASAVCAAATGVASKRHGTGMHPAALNAPAMLVGGMVLAAASVAVGDGFRIPSDLATAGAVAYLAIPGSIVTFLVYFSLLKTWNVTSLSFIAVFTPAIALVLGFVFLDERPTLWTGAGAALVLMGVSLTITGAHSAEAHAPTPPRT